MDLKDMSQSMDPLTSLAMRSNLTDVLNQLN